MVPGVRAPAPQAWRIEVCFQYQHKKHQVYPFSWNSCDRRREQKKEAPWFSVYQPSTRLTIVLWEILSLINKVYSDRAGHLNLTLASECTNMGKCMPSQRCTNITHTSHTETHARTHARSHTHTQHTYHHHHHHQPNLKFMTPPFWGLQLGKLEHKGWPLLSFLSSGCLALALGYNRS